MDPHSGIGFRALSAAAPLRKEAYESYKKGIHALETSQCDVARSYFTQAITIDPVDRESRNGMFMVPYFPQRELDKIDQSCGSSDLQSTVRTAEFLLNLTYFVEWPAESYPTPQSPTKLCLLADQALVTALETTIAGKTSANHPLEIQSVHQVADLADCHLFYVAADQVESWESWRSAIQTQALLTVSTLDSFIQSGGMTRLTWDNNRPLLEINLAACQKSGLHISSKLLKMAKIISP